MRSGSLVLLAALKEAHEGAMTRSRVTGVEGVVEGKLL